MLPGDRLIVAFVEQVAEGVAFRGWPLHITIVPWFRNDVVSEVIARDLEEKLIGIGPFQAKVGGTNYFGRHRKPVELIEVPSPFEQTEQIVRRYLKEIGSWIVDETTHIQRPYRPHITRQGTARAQAEDRVEITKLALVQQYGDYKKLEQYINLDK